MRVSALLSALLVAATFAAATIPRFARAQPGSEAELARVQSEIAALERDLERQITRRDDGLAELREIELRLAGTRDELRAIEARIAEQTARQSRIAAEKDAAEQRLESEAAALSEQVRTSYMTGRQELVRLLLNQEGAADVGRMLVYYEYLNRLRSERISAVDSELERIDALARENDEVVRELAGLRAEQETRVARLEVEQSERQQLVTDLDAAIESSGQRIERMRAEEAALADTIARLAEILDGFAVNSDAPFEAQRGGLPWPVEGPLAARFGDKRDENGLIRWTGVLLAAAAGTPVRAVYGGQVIHAQWHTHMGLLVIIDHGGGYWSLYGHNSALLRERGDVVRAGEIIAEVGNTGGQVESGLYFSILRDQQPLDPSDWVH